MTGATKQRRRIAILTPVARQVDADFAASLLKTVSSVSAEIGWLHVVGHANLPRARNVLVAKALELGVDDVVFIDSDIGWEPEAFAALFEVPEGVDVVAGCPQRRVDDEISFCGSPKINGEARVLGDLITGYAATAFLRIRSRVFEALKPKVARFDYQDTEAWAWFDYKVDENPFSRTRGFIGEDFYFSMLCMENGIDVWLDPTISLRHWNASPLTARMSDHLEVKLKEA